MPSSHFDRCPASICLALGRLLGREIPCPIDLSLWRIIIGFGCIPTNPASPVRNQIACTRITGERQSCFLLSPSPPAVANSLIIFITISILQCLILHAFLISSIAPQSMESSKVTINNLDRDHLDAFRCLLQRILSTQLAENVFAQIVDGLPTRHADSYMVIPYSPEVHERDAPSSAALNLVTEWRSAFLTESLAVDSNVSVLFFLSL